MVAGQAQVEAFFHKPTSTVSYIVADAGSGRCAIVDPALDFEITSGRTGTGFADAICAKVEELGLAVDWILETHVHADHLTAAPYIQETLGGRIAIGSGIGEVQRTFKPVYNLEPEFATDGSQFDRLFGDGERFEVGSLAASVMHTPGHTPACVSYRIGDAVFVGDALFMPDFGTARCDFPGGDCRALYRSTQRILALPPETRIFVGHDYAPGGREVAWESTVAEQRAQNKHVHLGIDEDDFVALRRARDRELSLPNLMLPAIQVNIRAGRLPPAEDNGRSYLKIPLNAF